MLLHIKHQIWICRNQRLYPRKALQNMRHVDKWNVAKLHSISHKRPRLVILSVQCGVCLTGTIQQASCEGAGCKMGGITPALTCSSNEIYYITAYETKWATNRSSSRWWWLFFRYHRILRGGHGPQNYQSGGHYPKQGIGVIYETR